MTAESETITIDEVLRLFNEANLFLSVTKKDTFFIFAIHPKDHYDLDLERPNVPNSSVFHHASLLDIYHFLMGFKWCMGMLDLGE
jgi:hypothetical protein